MNASSILRKLKDLDQLEERVKTLKEPSANMLKEIAKARDELLNGKQPEKQK